MFKQGRVALVNGLLFLGLGGLLFAYIVLVNDLPSQIYTATQQEYLSYNYSRNISQQAPTLNLIESGNPVASVNLPGQKSIVKANLVARYEEQENVSVTVYDLDFHGQYHLAHTGSMPTTVELFFPFPANLETLHDVRFLIDGEESPGTHYSISGISWQAVLEAGTEHQIVISYKADGVNSFAYGLQHNQRSDVDVTITVAGLIGSEVPNSALPTTANEVIEGSEIFTWSYKNLIADRDIQLTLPARLSFAQRIAQLQDDFRTLSTLAPFLVGSFLVSLGGVLHLSDIRLPRTNYLLIGFGLALFYPTFTFLSGVVNVVVAASLALLLVSGLLLVFLSFIFGWRQIWWRIGLLLVVFLGIFSLGMLTPWRGLLLSLGGLLLVGIFMLLYARRPVMPEPEPTLEPVEITPEPGLPLEPAEVTPNPELLLESVEIVLEPDPILPPDETTPASTNLYCPHCARELVDNFSFCPGCGHDTNCLHRCTNCDHRQFIPADVESAYCLNCGQSFS